MINDKVTDYTLAFMVIGNNLEKTGAKAAIFPKLLQWLRSSAKTQGTYKSPAGYFAMIGSLGGFSRAHQRGENPFVGAAMGAGLGYAGGSLAVKTPYLRELFKQTPISPEKIKTLEKSKAFRQQRDLATAEHKRRVARQTDKSIGLRARQAKEYFKEVGEDIKHPVQSLRRQYHKFTKEFDPATGAVTRKSPFEQAYMGYLYGGIPVSFAASALTTREAPASHRIGGAIGNIASMATPKLLPSLGAFTAAESIFPTQKYRMAAGDLSQSVPTPQIPAYKPPSGDPYSFYYQPQRSSFYY